MTRQAKLGTRKSLQRSDNELCNAGCVGAGLEAAVRPHIPTAGQFRSPLTKRQQSTESSPVSLVQGRGFLQLQLINPHYTGVGKYSEVFGWQQARGWTNRYLRARLRHTCVGNLTPEQSSAILFKLTPWLLVRKRTIPTDRPPLVGEVSANFCG
jgi:hypothetical protein